MGTAGRWVSMGVASDGSYGIPADTMFGFPVTCERGDWRLVTGLSIDEFSRTCLDRTLAELNEERQAVAQLLG
jgi:malate dehydrogenase